MTTPIVTRPAGPDDLDDVLANVAAGFASYRAFAPTGWEPPAALAGRDLTADVLADPDTWALLALVDAAPAGHVAFMPARERSAADSSGSWRSRPIIAGLAHLWQLFVLPEWWGLGVAPSLHESAIAEMRARGYLNARLFTPSAHARARRFYERRGWVAGPEEWNDHLGLALVEYRLDLSARPAAQAPGSQPGL